MTQIKNMAIDITDSFSG